MEKEILTTAHPFKIYAYFVLGLSTAIAFRALIVLNHVQPSWVRPMWYFGVLGNFIFFHYRYKVTEKRKKVVAQHQLIEKINSGAPLTLKDREAITYLLRSIKLSPENINYLIIFLFSLLAIGMDLVLAFL